MTTEIAILNKSGVALAADSAVTISVTNGNASQIAKIYANANKLFELVRGRPVGLMVYNNADVSGVPWETLVKSYRGENGTTAHTSTLRDFAEKFLGFVEATLVLHVPVAVQDSETCVAVKAFVVQFLAAADRVYGAIPGRVKRRQQLQVTIDQLQADNESQPVEPWATEIDEESLWIRLQSALLGAVPDRWCEAALPVALRRKLARLGLTLLLREEHARSAWSGIVISGFGDDELFPSLYHVTIAGVVDGHLRWLSSTEENVSVTRRAIIQPYAQTSEAVMFLQGIDPEMSEAISAFWEKWSTTISKSISKLAQDVLQPDIKDLNAFGTQLSEYMKTSWQSFGDFMNDEYHRPRMEPIEASASFLSKGEIADLAENLVELTSLRNRVSLDRQETVGGATDVAVISKGDGFVWVKRKHYFDRDRNPTWALRQTLQDVLLSPTRAGEGTTDGDDIDPVGA